MRILPSLLLGTALVAGFITAVITPSARAQDPMAEYDRMMAACVNEVAPDYAENFYAIKDVPITADNFEEALAAARKKAKPFTPDNLADLSKCIKDKGYKVSAIDDFSMYVEETLENPDKSEEIARKYGVGEAPAVKPNSSFYSYTPAPPRTAPVFVPPEAVEKENNATNKNEPKSAPTLYNQPR